jgi:integrase
MVETILLTDAAVRRLKPGTKLRWIRDAGARSLYLLIAPRRDGDKRNNAKSWLMRFRDLDGRPRKIVLGPYDLSGYELKDTPQIGQPLGVAAARALAADVHRRRMAGEDVAAEHRARKIRRRTEAAEKVTLAFGTCAVEFVRDYRTKWHSRPRRWFEYAHILGLHWPRDCDPTKVEPEVIRGGLAERWADKPVTEIDEADIITTVEAARKHGIPGLERHNDSISENRGRNVYAVLSIFFRWLQARRRVLRNVCRDIHHAGPPPSRARVLSNDEIRWLWRACDAESLYEPLVKLLILKGQRLNEIAGMRRSELNDENKTLWTIPAARTKNHREHLVPLAPLARELLGNIETSGDPIFSTTGTTPVSGWNRLKRRLDRAMLQLARQERGISEIPHWQFHDLRRTFVTGCGELGIRPDVIELAVNHQSGLRGGVAGTYNKSQLLPERKEAFERWAAHVIGIVDQRPANVTQLKSKTRRGKA